jgi:hypothetical protein
MLVPDRDGSGLVRENVDATSRPGAAQRSDPFRLLLSRHEETARDRRQALEEPRGLVQPALVSKGGFRLEKIARHEDEIGTIRIRQLANAALPHMDAAKVHVGEQENTDRPASYVSREHTYDRRIEREGLDEEAVDEQADDREEKGDRDNSACPQGDPAGMGTSCCSRRKANKRSAASAWARGFQWPWFTVSEPCKGR